MLGIFLSVQIATGYHPRSVAPPRADLNPPNNLRKVAQGGYRCRNGLLHDPCDVCDRQKSVLFSKDTLVPSVAQVFIVRVVSRVLRVIRKLIKPKRQTATKQTGHNNLSDIFNPCVINRFNNTNSAAVAHFVSDYFLFIVGQY